MAQLNRAIDPSTVPADDRDGNFEPFPAGIYDLQIIESSLNVKEQGVNEMLTLQIEVIGPTYAGRQIFENLCIVHPNGQAQDIAARTVKKICEAVGHQGVLTDSDALHFKPAKGRVAIEPGKNGYGPKNVVKAWLPLDGNAPAAAAPRHERQAAAAEKPAPEAKKTAPWRK